MSDHAFTEESSPLLWQQPEFLSIAGDKIKISLLDGHVELNGIEPNEAAKLFWKAVEHHIPKP